MDGLNVDGWKLGFDILQFAIIGAFAVWNWLDRRAMARRDELEDEIRETRREANAKLEQAKLDAQAEINHVRADADRRIAAVRDEAHERLEDHENRLREKRERLTRVEEHQRTTPTHTDVAHVVELINAVKGDLLRGLAEVQKDTLRETAQLGAQVQAVAGGMTGVGARLDLITQHLMKVNT
jgi:E3 ubiquitin-protein ligase DOA10